MTSIYINKLPALKKRVAEILLERQILLCPLQHASEIRPPGACHLLLQGGDGPTGIGLGLIRLAQLRQKGGSISNDLSPGSSELPNLAHH